MKTFIKFFFCILIVDVIISMIQLYPLPPNLTFISSILRYISSTPLQFIRPYYPYYAPGSIQFSLMLIFINTLLQTTAVYVLWRVFKLSRR